MSTQPPGDAPPPADTPSADTPSAASGGFDMNRPSVIALLYLGGFVTGVSAIVGLILGYVWQGEPHEAWMTSHYRYLIRTFWIGIVWAIVAGIGTVISFGLLAFVLFPLVSVWFIVRNVKALLAAQRHEAIANVESWMF